MPKSWPGCTVFVDLENIIDLQYNVDPLHVHDTDKNVR